MGNPPVNRLSKEWLCPIARAGLSGREPCFAAMRYLEKTSALGHNNIAAIENR
jgi:hypothetical protein